MFHSNQFFVTSRAKLKRIAIASMTLGALFVTGSAQAVLIVPNGITIQSTPMAAFDNTLVQQVHARTRSEERRVGKEC